MKSKPAVKQNGTRRTSISEKMKAVKTEIAVRKVGRPKKNDEVAHLKSRLQEVMLQSAMRYIALQQMNRGLNRLNKKIDRLRHEAQNREVMYSQVARMTEKVLGAAARGELNEGAFKVTGPGAQSLVNNILHEATRVKVGIEGRE